MNYAILGALTVAVVGIAIFSGPPRELIAGRPYQATFRTPKAALSAQAAFIAGLKTIAPPGAVVAGGGDSFSFTFVAPRTSKLRDLETPFGVAKLLELVELDGMPAVGSVVQPVQDVQRQLVATTAALELGSADAAKYWASASPRVNMLGADWCGAFALWALHQSGLALDWVWEPRLGFLMTSHHRLPITQNPQVGDVAYFEKNQHEAVVVSVEPGLVHLINGNGPGGIVTASTVRPSDVTAFFSIAPLLSTTELAS